MELKLSRAIGSASAFSLFEPNVDHMPSRKIFLNMRLPNYIFDARGRPLGRPFPRNDISTSKYSLLTFIPRNLFEQFRRFANIFFLTLVILQFFPTYQTINPWIAAVPLFLVVTATAIKDALEDYRRHVSDYEINTMPARRLANWTNTNEPLFAKPTTIASILSPCFLWVYRLFGVCFRISDTHEHRPVHGQVEPEMDEFDQDATQSSPRRSRGHPLPQSATNATTNTGTYNTSNDKPRGDIPSSNAKKGSEASPNGGGPSPTSRVGATAINVTVVSASPVASIANGATSPADAIRSKASAAQTPSNAITPTANSASLNVPQQFEMDPPTPECGDLNKDWEQIQWCDVRVGDIVLLRDNDQIPGDMVVLSTSEPEGLCYVETKNLDGETNLKIRKTAHETLAASTPEQLHRLRCCLEYEKPHSSIYSFVGTIANFTQSENGSDATSQQSSPIQAGPSDPNHSTSEIQPRSSLQQEGPGIHRLPVGINNLLLRGCILRKTAWVCGVIVYTGNETKICLNSGETPIKRSLIEIQTNFYILLSLGFMVIIAISNAVANIILERNGQANQAPWLDYTFSGDLIDAGKGISAFWIAVILYQNLVPISLYITVEIAKSLQSFFIYEDIDMYDAGTNERCLTRSWNLADDLGQIEYVFSDKTGTLTRNIMDFRRCSVNGVVYGASVAERMSVASIANSLTEQNSGQNRIPQSGSGGTKTASAHPNDSQNGMYGLNEANGTSDLDPFFDPNLEKDLKGDRTTPHFRVLEEFFSCLALCHTVLVTHSANGKVSYKAQSPDESALVKVAATLGFMLTGRRNSNVMVDILGTPQTHQVLNVIEFNSARKRMSVILRRPSGDIVLYCKGADSVIYERLAPGQDALCVKTLSDLERFAEEGLRTLCIAMVKLSETQYAEWTKMHQRASIAIEGREERMEQAAELIECNMTLLGATAIEDKLQEGVPECIGTLLSAGIRLWVLTGDKMETAINIGYSCSLLSHEVTLILIRGGSNVDDEGSTLLQMNEALKRFFGSRDSTGSGSDSKSSRSSPKESASGVHATTSDEKEMDTDAKVEQVNNNNKDIRTGTDAAYALIIDGRALFHALSDDAKDTFLELSTRCSTVICCRVSPLQKAKVVQLIKTKLGAMCLAIGDGANDVSMIQSAQIGVGIYGEEGLQAAMAADYAVSQFRFLSKLVLVHGRWCYGRTARMILDFFFKNMVFNMPLILYQFVCGYSFQPSYDAYYMILANVLFTSLPVGFLGAFDKDVSADMAMLFPQLYMSGIHRSILTHAHVAIVVFEAVYYSIAIMLIHIYVTQDTTITMSGQTENYLYTATSLSIIALTLSNLHVGTSIVYWTWIMFGGIFGSIFLILVFLAIEMRLPISPSPNFETVMYGTPVFWFSFLLTVVVCMLPKFAIGAFVRAIAPSDVAIVQEMEMDHLALTAAVAVSSGILAEAPNQVGPAYVPVTGSGVGFASDAETGVGRSTGGVAVELGSVAITTGASTLSPAPAPTPVPKQASPSTIVVVTAPTASMTSNALDRSSAAEESQLRSASDNSSLPSPTSTPRIQGVFQAMSPGSPLRRAFGPWSPGGSHPLPRRSYFAALRRFGAGSFRASARRSASRQHRSFDMGTPPPHSPAGERDDSGGHGGNRSPRKLFVPTQHAMDDDSRVLAIADALVASPTAAEPIDTTSSSHDKHSFSVVVTEAGTNISQVVKTPTDRRGTANITAIQTNRIETQGSSSSPRQLYQSPGQTRHPRHRKSQAQTHSHRNSIVRTDLGSKASVGFTDTSSVSSRHHTSSGSSDDDTTDGDSTSRQHGLTTLETGHFTRERGFSFSQSPGAAETIMPRVSTVGDPKKVGGTALKSDEDPPR